MSLDPSLPAIIGLSIHDALHYTEADRQERIAGYLEHERDARAYGIPMLGSGLIFPVADERLVVEDFPIPSHWRQIGGMDFGIDHPFASIRLALDLDTDAFFVTATYSERGKRPLEHAAVIKPWGAWLPWAWPHDGLQHDKGSGNQLKEIYRSHELNLLSDFATFPDGGFGVEAGLTMMLEMIQAGKLKLFASCAEPWLVEKRSYHRKDGKVVKEGEDLISATRYAIMMARFAELPPAAKSASGLWKPPGW